MAKDNETISLLRLAPRVAKLVTAPGALNAMRWGMRPPQNAKNVSAGQQLAARAAEQPDAPALHFGDDTYSWGEFNAWANRYAAYFKDRGVKKGDCIVINVSNRAETLVSAMAAAKLGAMAALINTSQRGDVLAHSIKTAEGSLIIVGEEQLEAMDSLPEDAKASIEGKCLFVPEVDSDTDAPDGYVNLTSVTEGLSENNPAETAAVSLKDPFMLVFTSGTTGLPKASIMSHLRWYRGGISMAKLAMRMDQSDVLYCCLPLYHNNAMTLALSSVTLSGASLAVARKFSASRFWDDCIHYGATGFCYVGELLRYLLNQAPSAKEQEHKVEKIFGNGLRPDIWDDFKSRFAIDRVHEFYGASEGPAAFVNVFNFDRTFGYCPLPWEIVAYDVDADEVVRDEKGFLKKLGKGDTGLLITEVNENTPFDGYTDKEASEKKLLRNVFKQGDCWFNSGDLIKSLGWNHGQFVDRVGDTFRWQGENVATTEVEAAVGRWHQTEDACVYGVEVPGRDGRCGMLSYTLAEGESLDAEGFASFLNKELPKYAVPRFMRIREAQEITGTFKHQKAKLKKEAYKLEEVSEALYFLEPGGASWKPLDAELVARIDGGEQRV